MNEVSRCTGHCCEDFTLPVSPMQFKWWAKLISLGKKPGYMKHTPWRRWAGEVYDPNRGYFTHHYIPDIEKIAAMVIFKFADKTCKNNLGNKVDHVLYHYTCKHFDKKSGNCMNYENRPDMCRNYPNGGKCNYRGCTRACAFKDEAALEKKIDEPTPVL